MDNAILDVFINSVGAAATSIRGAQFRSIATIRIDNFYCLSS